MATAATTGTSDMTCCYCANRVPSPTRDPFRCVGCQRLKAERDVEYARCIGYYRSTPLAKAEGK